MSIAEKTLQLKQDFDDVYEAGKQAQYDDYADSFQNFGKRTNYGYAFYQGAWTADTIPIKYDMHLTAAQNLFMGTSAGTLNFEKVIEEKGVVFDTSNCTIFDYAFSSTCVTHVPILDTRSCDKLTALIGWGNKVESVRKVILKNDGSQTFQYFAQATANIKEIRFEGCIGQDINFQWSTKLTLESLVSILTCLKNYDVSGEQWTKTITLSSESWALLDEQGEVATSPVTGEACTWRVYVEHKCWKSV